MPENEINNVEQYREQISRMRNAFLVMRIQINAMIDKKLNELERLENESRTQSSDRSGPA